MESKIGQNLPKKVYFWRSLFSALFPINFSDFRIFQPFQKGRPCDSMQTLHALARFVGFALFGSKTPRGVDFALILMISHLFWLLLASKSTQKDMQTQEGKRMRKAFFGPCWTPFW